MLKREGLKYKLIKASPKIPNTGGKIYSRLERMKMADEVFPYSRFGSHISEQEIKNRLRELRRDEFRANSQTEKTKAKRLREYLERELDMKGKY